MEIRRARPEEFEATGDVTVASYREFVPEGDSSWDEYLESLRDVAGRADRAIVLVAVDDGRLLGTATIELDEPLGDDDVELPADTSCLRMLGVLPEARGRGVGRALIEATIERTRRAGKRQLILRTTDRMLAAQRLYRSLGFVRDPSIDMSFPEVELIGFRMPLGDPASGR